MTHCRLGLLVFCFLKIWFPSDGHAQQLNASSLDLEIYSESVGLYAKGYEAATQHVQMRAYVLNLTPLSTHLYFTGGQNGGFYRDSGRGIDGYSSVDQYVGIGAKIAYPWGALFLETRHSALEQGESREEIQKQQQALARFLVTAGYFRAFGMLFVDPYAELLGQQDLFVQQHIAFRELSLTPRFGIRFNRYLLLPEMPLCSDLLTEPVYFVHEEQQPRQSLSRYYELRFGPRWNVQKGAFSAQLYLQQFARENLDNGTRMIGKRGLFALGGVF